MSNDILFQALTDAEAQVRYNAALQIGTARPAGAARLVVDRIGAETDPAVRENITWAAAQLAPESTPMVVELLSSPDAPTRMQAAHVLSKIGDPSIAEHLSGVIADQDPQVAVKAFRAAAATGSEAVLKPLYDRLGTGDQELRDALSLAFAQLGSMSVAPLLEALEHADRDVRLHALDALGQLGTEADEAAPHVAAVLGEDDADLRLAAVTTLGQMSPESTEELLQFAAGSDDARVAEAARSLLRQQEL